MNKASKLHTSTEDLSGFKILFVNDTKSTNDLAKIISKQDNHHPLVIRTDFQTDGRGQNLKKWKANSGENILCTFSYPTLIIIKEGLFRLNYIAVMTVINTLEKYGLKAFFKWPNDIISGNKKICGILTETSLRGEYINFVYSGVGLNVNESFNDKKLQNATSVFDLKGVKQDITEIFELLVNEYAAIQYSALSVSILQLENMLSNYLWNKDIRQPFLNLESGNTIMARPVKFKYNHELEIQVEDKLKTINYTNYRWII